MSQTRHSEAAFETVIETYLLANAYVTVNRDGFDPEGHFFPRPCWFSSAPPNRRSGSTGTRGARRQNAPLSCSRSVVPRL
jgi:hypothetical protein